MLATPPIRDAPPTISAWASRVVSGVGASMVLAIDVESLVSGRFVLQVRWRDLLVLEASLVREGFLARGRLQQVTSNGRLGSDEKRLAAADALLARALATNVVPPKTLVDFLQLQSPARAALPPQPMPSSRVRLPRTSCLRRH